MDMNKILFALVLSIASVSAFARGFGVVVVPVVPVQREAVIVDEGPVFYGDVDLVDSDAFLAPEEGVVINFADCFGCFYSGGFWFGGDGHRYEPRHERREGFDHHNHDYRGHGRNSGHEGHRH